MSDYTGWFAGLSDEADRNPIAPWQPFIQTAGGCFPLPLWYATEEGCLDAIEHDILGRGLLDGSRTPKP
ncbi:hypothetical protein [Streptomyces sp. NBC_01508]|uniref:hypothetical protein n=1 Tax=Streptomyces sp. NBC_01508 TaxID=2903888 RepID=UPI003862EF8D